MIKLLGHFLSRLLVSAILLLVGLVSFYATMSMIEFSHNLEIMIFRFAGLFVVLLTSFFTIFGFVGAATTMHPDFPSWNMFKRD